MLNLAGGEYRYSWESALLKFAMRPRFSTNDPLEAAVCQKAFTNSSTYDNLRAALHSFSGIHSDRSLLKELFNAVSHIFTERLGNSSIIDHCI